MIILYVISIVTLLATLLASTVQLVYWSPWWLFIIVSWVASGYMLCKIGVLK